MGHNTWFVVAVLLLYRPKIFVIMLPLTTSTVVIQLQQFSYLCLIVHYAGPFWVQNQNSWSKPGLLWRYEVADFKNKNLAQQEDLENIPFTLKSVF
jgi:predicted NUDIX family NTP pyrophosphohydrolase